MIIKLFILLFIAFAIGRIVQQRRRHSITGRELVVWLVFWGLVALATITPKSTDTLAQAVGVGRGADLLVYCAVIALFFIVFKVIVRVQTLDRQVTDLVRRLALHEKIDDAE